MKSFNYYYINYCIKKIIDGLPSLENGVFLDLGCGGRPYHKYYEGMYPTVIEADYEKRSNEINLILDAQKIPLKDSTVDVILFSEVIEHLPDHRLAMDEITRVLKDGGFLIITWPFMFSMHELPWDYYRITEYGMKKLSDDAGLHLLRLYRRGGVFSLFFVLVIQIILFGLAFFERVPLLGMLFRFINRAFSYPVLSLGNSIISILAHRLGKPVSEYGEGLSGVGHLRLWTLGYVALMKKT